MERIVILDTTLYQGGQAHFMSMSFREKLAIAKQLQFIGVDIIEVGAPSASAADFHDVRMIASEITDSVIAVAAGPFEHEIEIASKALDEARNKMLHLSIAPPTRYLAFRKISMTDLIREVARCVELAKSFCHYVEVGVEDALRADKIYLLDLFHASIESGAEAIGIDDNSGYGFPSDISSILQYIRNNMKEIDNGNIQISIHCRNDLGLAIANTIAAVQAGARQVELSIMGVGEGGGNAALEEFLAALSSRKELSELVTTGIRKKDILKTCILVSSITGVVPPPYKPVIGTDVFVHRHDQHTNRSEKNGLTPEVLSSHDFGWSERELMLDHNYGTRELRSRIKMYSGNNFNEHNYNLIMKELTNRSNLFLPDTELLVLLEEFGMYENPVYILEQMTVEPVNTRTRKRYHTSVTLRCSNDLICHSAVRGNSIRSLIAALSKTFPPPYGITHYEITAAGLKNDHSVRACVYVGYYKQIMRGESRHPDLYHAFAEATLDALNRLMFLKYNGGYIRNTK